MHDYIRSQCGHSTVSEYFRSLVRREQQRRADYAARPVRGPMRANDCGVIANALDQLDRLKQILERKDDDAD
jgi:hypothetical protein